ncbi:MAG: PIN domain-containing protein [Candidatus Thiosymbion ectosymbiont of Robbea hypermnestra]|nr:PIN domain-containing protein [Candidatus Thiosymbion ectosymbiont of Robbea hypermnestra]
MISIDTNILLYAQNRDCPENERAFEFVVSYGKRKDVVLCELVLVELYILLRNPSVLQYPLPANQAADVCRAYRQNPRWHLVENAPVMDQVWALASQPDYPRRRIFDARIALTLLHHGVTELATANVKDFGGFGFHRVWNPLRDEPEAPFGT